jgi:alkanesulfonate monooxygenase SsuD/methylene tetrahydromethanopterin reductase-like flavin-dependent oxidoreductase (luciferase family)
VHDFRFGAIEAPHGTTEDWLATARRALDLGFSTLLTPDGTQQHAPFPALAAASTVPGLRLGTFVLAAPLRPPRSAAWEGHTLSVLSGGRFEFGIGTGRPDARAEAESFGLPWGSGAERLSMVRETVAHLRKLDAQGGDRQGQRTPVLIAAAGPRALALAAEEADIVTLAAPPLTPRAEVARMSAELRERAGDRDVEIAMNLFVVGTEVPPWTRRFLGVDPATLDERESLAVLRGTPRQMADELLRRRDELGVTYFVTSASYGEALAPVVELLTR